MVQTPVLTLTLEAFLKLPETKPASEYIDGHIVQKSMPQGKHSRLQRKLLSAINTVVEEKGIAEAFPELRFTFGGRSIVPDIAIVLRERIPIDDQGHIANKFELCPDWTIEILSPDQNEARVIDNILYCLEQGCKMGWLVNPIERSVCIYPAGHQPKIFRAATSNLWVPDFAEAFELTAGELFSWLQM